MKIEEKLTVSGPENDKGIMINDNPVPLSEDMKIVFITGDDGSENEYTETYADFVRRGYLVLNSGSFSLIDRDGSYQGKDAESLYKQEIHNSIRIASLVYVVNPGGCISKSAKEDIEFAKSIGKEIEYYNDNICEDDVYKYIDETCLLTVAKLKDKFAIIERTIEAIDKMRFGFKFMSDEEEHKIMYSPKELPESKIPLIKINLINSEPNVSIYYTNILISIFVENNTLKVNITYPKEDNDRYGQAVKSEFWFGIVKNEVVIDVRITEGIDPISAYLSEVIIQTIRDEFETKKVESADATDFDGDQLDTLYIPKEVVHDTSNESLSMAALEEFSRYTTL